MGMKEALQKKATEAAKKGPDVRRLKGVLRSDSAADRVAVLQRSIGNRAVERLFKSGVIQAKLRIGQPNDIYEQEADRAADVVSRMPGDTAISGQHSATREKGEAIQLKPG